MSVCTKNRSAYSDRYTAFENFISTHTCLGSADPRIVFDTFRTPTNRRGVAL